MWEMKTRGTRAFHPTLQREQEQQQHLSGWPLRGGHFLRMIARISEYIICISTYIMYNLPQLGPCAQSSPPFAAFSHIPTFCTLWIPICVIFGTRAAHLICYPWRNHSRQCFNGNHFQGHPQLPKYKKPPRYNSIRVPSLARMSWESQSPWC